MERYLSRKFLLALVVSVVGLVRLFVDVPESLVDTITNGVLILGSVVAYVVANVEQKKIQP
jgi:hypothetical protein